MGQFQAGERQTGRAGLQFAIGLAVVFIEKPPTQAEGLLVKGQGTSDAVAANLSRFRWHVISFLDNPRSSREPRGRNAT